MLYSEPLQSIADLPKKEKDRNFTDIVCVIIGLFFVIFMLIMASVSLKIGAFLLILDNYYKSNYPTDSDHIPCSYGANQRYPMVYFPDVNDASKRVCVSVCPNQNDKQLICRANSQVKHCKFSDIYQTSPDWERLGGFCGPIDTNLKETLINNSSVSENWAFLKTYDITKLSILIAFIIGLTWLILAQVIPYAISFIAIILSVLISVGIGLLFLIDSPKSLVSKPAIKLFIGIFMLIIAVIIISFIIFARKKIVLMGLFLAWSTDWVKQSLVFFIWIPIFSLFAFGLIFLVYFQRLAFISQNDPQPSDNSIYLNFSPIYYWQILNIIEFIWGLQFLKDTFNFIISGSATQWYLRQSENGFLFSFCRMLKYHLGSVIGGSFLNAFFNLIDFALQMVRCYPDGRLNKMAQCCNVMFQKLFCFCSMVRTDAYSYINMAGIPYCNACKNCQQINRKSKQFIGSQSVQFFYRGCCYISCVGLCLIISYLIERIKINTINLQSLVVIMMLSYFVLAFFIDFNANAAQGIHVASVLERHFGGYQNLRTHQKWKKQLQTLLKQLSKQQNLFFQSDRLGSIPISN